MTTGQEHSTACHADIGDKVAASHREAMGLSGWTRVDDGWLIRELPNGLTLVVMKLPDGRFRAGIQGVYRTADYPATTEIEAIAIGTFVLAADVISALKVK